MGEVMYTEVFERDGKSLGCGYVFMMVLKKKNSSFFSSVEFRTVDEAKRAVEKMHQFEYGGRKLAVKLVSHSDHCTDRIILPMIIL